MRYLTSEFRRSFLSYKFLIGITGVAFAQVLSIYKIAGINTSVYATYERAVYFIPYSLSFIFCTVPYAQSFCEDIEHGYIRQITLRKDLKFYVKARIGFICLSSIITMIFGTLLFISIAHIKVPWLSEVDHLDQDILAVICLKTGHYILYFMLRAFFWGLLAGLLAVLSAYFSLFWLNKLFVISIPFIMLYALIYFMRTIFKNIPQMDIALIFNPSYNAWGNKTISFIWPIGLTVLMMSIIEISTCHKLRQEDNKEK